MRMKLAAPSNATARRLKYPAGRKRPRLPAGARNHRRVRCKRCRRAARRVCHMPRSILERRRPGGETRVGAEVHGRHLAATPLGMHVRARVVLEAIDGRFLTFSAEVYDDKEKVGEGTHKRAIIRSDRFMARVQEK